MLVKQTINNNAALVIDEQEQEIVVLGKGVGFSLKAGDTIDQQKIDKKFTLEDKSTTQKYVSLIANATLEDITFVQSLITFIQDNFSIKLKETIHVALTDHILFVHERYLNNELVPNLLHSEIKRFYPQEFKVGERVVQLMDEHFGITLPNDEASFIAMHIVNAELGETDSVESVSIIEKLDLVMSIIDNSNMLEIEKDTLNYDRLLIHIKYFIQRFNYDKQWEDDPTSFIDERIKMTIGYKISEDISKEITKRYNVAITEEEQVYLAIHLNRLRK